MLQKFPLGGAILILIVLSLSGCNSSSSTEGGYDQTKVYTGTTGLTMRFMPNMPPSRIYAGTPFTIVLEVTNDGAFPQDNADVLGNLYITGYDPIIMNIADPDVPLQDMDLYGRDMYRKEGARHLQEFVSTGGAKLPSNTEVYRPTIKATMCYDYRTEADAMICWDNDPYSTKTENKVCQINDVSLGGGQGGPVAVTKIEQEKIRDGMQFRIYVQNVGGGKVIEEGTSGLCQNPGLDFNEYDKVNYAVSIHDQTITECSPTTITLYNNQGFALCKATGLGRDESAYTTPIHVTLTYGYKESITRQIEIINVPDGR